jgi:hypothetical protein
LLEQPVLKQLAVELVEEAEQLADVDQMLASAMEYFTAVREQRDKGKLVAELRRSKDALPEREQGTDSEAEVLMLKQLSEKAKQPDLRRVV